MEWHDHFGGESFKTEASNVDVVYVRPKGTDYRSPHPALPQSLYIDVKYDTMRKRLGADDTVPLTITTVGAKVVDGWKKCQVI
jgi:hypothetical protein